MKKKKRKKKRGQAAVHWGLLIPVWPAATTYLLEPSTTGCAASALPTRDVEQNLHVTERGFFMMHVCSVMRITCGAEGGENIASCRVIRSHRAAVSLM